MKSCIFLMLTAVLAENSSNFKFSVGHSEKQISVRLYTLGETTRTAIRATFNDIKRDASLDTAGSREDVAGRLDEFYKTDIEAFYLLEFLHRLPAAYETLYTAAFKYLELSLGLLRSDITKIASKYAPRYQRKIEGDFANLKNAITYDIKSNAFCSLSMCEPNEDIPLFRELVDHCKCANPQVWDFRTEDSAEDVAALSKIQYSADELRTILDRLEDFKAELKYRFKNIKLHAGMDVKGSQEDVAAPLDEFYQFEIKYFSLWEKYWKNVPANYDEHYRKVFKSLEIAFGALKNEITKIATKYTKRYRDDIEKEFDSIKRYMNRFVKLVFCILDMCKPLYEGYKALVHECECAGYDDVWDFQTDNFNASKEIS